MGAFRDLRLLVEAQKAWKISGHWCHNSCCAPEMNILIDMSSEPYPDNQREVGKSDETKKLVKSVAGKWQYQGLQHPGSLYPEMQADLHCPDTISVAVAGLICIPVATYVITTQTVFTQGALTTLNCNARTLFLHT